MDLAPRPLYTEQRVRMASVDALVAAFFKGLGEDGLDEDVRAYVSATVSAVDEDSDPADIAEMFAGFSPAFSELGAECQMSEVLLLLTAAREATTKGGPPEDHGERVAYGALSGSDASSGGDVASQEAEEAERQRLQQEEKEAKVGASLSAYACWRGLVYSDCWPGRQAFLSATKHAQTRYYG